MIAFNVVFKKHHLALHIACIKQFFMEMMPIFHGQNMLVSTRRKELWISQECWHMIVCICCYINPKFIWSREFCGFLCGRLHSGDVWTECWRMSRNSPSQQERLTCDGWISWCQHLWKLRQKNREFEANLWSQRNKNKIDVEENSSFSLKL